MSTSLDQSTKDMMRIAAARQSASLILHALQRFIPEAAKREAHDCLMDAFYRERMEITTLEQRERMIELHNQLAATGPLSVNPTIDSILNLVRETKP